jgi:uncharacterized membrane protein YccC
VLDLIGEIMDYLEIFLLLFGVVALLVGFFKNNRYILLAAGIALLVAGGLGDFANGFMQGVLDSSPK